MAACVADEIASNTPLNEAPLPVAALEAVLVATATTGCSARSGSACRTVMYERETAVPASLSRPVEK
jgi:hypothetical protein